MASTSVMALLTAATPTAPASTEGNSVVVLSEAQKRIQALSASLAKMQATTKEASRCCDQLTKRARHLESLTTPASDASAQLSSAASNLTVTLQAMKDAREKFDTVSEFESTIQRLHSGVSEMEENRNKGDRKVGLHRMARTFRATPFEGLDDKGGGNMALSEQDVYAAADAMEILKDAFDYFLERKHWRSSPAALGGLERVHKLGVNSMCTLITSHLVSAGQALRLKRAGKKEGGSIVPPLNETSDQTRDRLTQALQNRDLMKSIGEYEEYQSVEPRPVREMRAVFECLGGDGYHLGPPRRKEPSTLAVAYGIPPNKVIRTEKVGSGGYTALVKKSLKTGFPQLDAYGEARKQMAFKAIDGYYRRIKAERKKSADRQGAADNGTVEFDDEADVAARDAVRCLEHAMVVVAGEKSVYRAVVAPSTQKATDEDATPISPYYHKACVAAYSYVAAAVVDRTMDIIETVFLKECGIGQSSGTKTEEPLSVRDAASAAAAGLRMLDGVRMLGPSLAKLCEMPLDESAVMLVRSGTMTVASTLCIAIHRTTVKNTAKTLENLVKSIKEDPLNGSKYRPPDARIASVSSDVVRAIRLISPFESAYKSVTKRRALPWDPNIGDEAGELESYVKWIVTSLKNNLKGKHLNYTRDPGEDAMAKSNMFMINNTFYLLQQLGPSISKKNTSKIDDYYRIESPWFERDIRAIFENEKSQYLAHWETINQFLTAVDTNALLYVKGNNVLSRESGKLFKSRFQDFNDEFDKIYHLHLGLSVIDPGLRATLIQDVKSVFLPRYHRFYEKYATIRFSKKKQDEYLKFPPDKVEELLDDLYSGEQGS